MFLSISFQIFHVFKLIGRSYQTVNHLGMTGAEINIRTFFFHLSDCGVFFLSFKSSSVVLLCYEEKSLLFNGSIEC